MTSHQRTVGLRAHQRTFGLIIFERWCSAHDRARERLGADSNWEGTDNEQRFQRTVGPVRREPSQEQAHATLHGAIPFLVACRARRVATLGWTPISLHRPERNPKKQALPPAKTQPDSGNLIAWKAGS